MKRPSIPIVPIAIALFALSYIYFSGDFLKGGLTFGLVVIAIYAELRPQRRGKAARKKRSHSPQVGETPRQEEFKASKSSEEVSPEQAQAEARKIKLIWASFEASIGCIGCSSGMGLRDWESPNPQLPNTRDPDEHP